MFANVSQEGDSSLLENMDYRMVQVELLWISYFVNRCDPTQQCRERCCGGNSNIPESKGLGLQSGSTSRGRQLVVSEGALANR